MATYSSPMMIAGIAALLTMTATAAAQNDVPKVFQSDGRDLAKSKQRAAGGDKQLAAAVAEVRKQADKALTVGPFSVVTNKKPRLAPSGDKHDYVSMAPYFWPDPSKKDGLPYIRKDGQTNPEREKYDAPVMRKMCQAVGQLSFGYYLTGEERYAEGAAKLLRVWYLDAQTLMNPNLNYGQFIPGITDGRGIGIIDTTAFCKVVDAVGMLAGSKSWTKADQAGMEKWFREYLQWNRTSKNGKEEAAAKNNHGTWFDAQVGAYALFVGEKEFAIKLLEESKQKRIALQIEPDGKQPLELARTKSFDYSRVNLDGLFALATLGDHVGVDLWHYQTKDGRSIRKALDWLIPFAMGEKKWENQQISKLNGGSLAPFLRRAAVAYKDDRYERLLEKLPNRANMNTTNLLYPGNR